MSIRQGIHTDGTFRVAAERGATYFVLEHKCSDRHDRDPGRWQAHMYCVDNRAVQCSWCNKAASEGLQVIFQFLKSSEPL